MPIQILMPALSPTMSEGTIANWVKAEGDDISSGDVLCEIETDKATMEVEAIDDGVLGKILIAGGTEGVAVNTPIAIILEEGEDASAMGDIDTTAPVPAAADAPPEPVAEPAPAPAAAPPPTATGKRVFASPLAKRLAQQNSLDIALISGSGPHGRVIRRDIEAALASGNGKAAPVVAAAIAPTTPALAADDPVMAYMPEYEAMPNSSMRKIIATRLTGSARDIPHFNVTVDVEIDELLRVRKQLNSRDGADYKISVNDFIIKAVALTLKLQPDCNVTYTDEAILKFKRQDVAMAVAIDGGLITPIIHDAGNKGLRAISETAKELAEKARHGKLVPEEFQGGTFTVSNLGMFGVKSFNSIINPPQGGILSVGAGDQRAVVKDGALTIATMMTLTLAVDHRCIDGATAATFTKELKGILEAPSLLML
ncbi:MAG: pyruvate dehydrogenase complex dihydrolipoamide acetyltransferase [Alphaproteobacteria bacterium]|nr:pyruvate dehydrogenase complex dihydrolipoamide acetyltransferase [Alphaproteobacteria bacterium]